MSSGFVSKKMSKLLILIVCIPALAFGQKKSSSVQIYDEKTDNGVKIYGINNEIVAYTVELEVQQKNLKSDVKFPFKAVLPANSGKTLIATLTTDKPNRGWSYGSHFTYYMGDYRAKHDDEFIYGLPFEKGKSFLMSQGYNGSFSHSGKNAIDFTMPIGSNIVASRGGVVVEVKEDSNRGCPNKSCLEFSNIITILHEDGTFADYVHLKKKGSFVSLGDRVKKGQLIGSSGETGFASGPHLHFEVYLPKKNGNQSVPTSFEIESGKAEKLKEKEFYTAF